MKKRWMPILLALLFAAALLPGTAFAAAGDGPAGSRLTGAEQAVYRVLKAEAARIADGGRSSTVVRVPDQSALSWTLTELGVKGGDQDAAVAKLKEKTEEALRMERVCTALTLDCPYEMFWNGLRYSYNCDYAIHGNRGYVQNLTVSFQPAQGFRGDGEYTVSPAKVDGAKAAAENARAIVEKHRDKADYEKLAAYREEICALVVFDRAAAQGDVPYGAPWQLVSVFDGDPDTNVVCEGYAKAFQYLCGLSEFRGDVVCRTVTGRMNGGDHMWNVVQMEDGRNYLVDVTNCDSGSVGAPDKLFLAGGSRSEEGRVYTVSAGGYPAVYAYGEEQEGLYADGYLALSESGYVPGAAQAGGPPKPAVTVSGPGGEAPREEGQTAASPAFTDVPSWFEMEVAWAVQRGITNGYGGSTTFAPNVECPHIQILTFLWRAEDKPIASAKCPAHVAVYYQEAANWAYEKGLIDDAFDPDALCTRADAVSYIWQALDRPEAGEAPCFSDVDAAAPYAGAVSWAVGKGVTKGYGGSDTFAPDRVCTRGEIAAFLYRAYH